MPNIAGKKFAYTTKGKKDAAEYKKKVAKLKKKTNTKKPTKLT